MKNANRFAALFVLLASFSLGLAASDKVVINTKATTEPISQYVYGQFIEHLGRCIYGGLWSEMLEDRKFLYPVAGEAPAWTMFKPSDRSWDGEGHPYELLTSSPWMILGDKASVSMVTENPYVGEHTPRIALPGSGAPAGLEQGRLGLVEGREYVGRVVLAGTEDAGPIKVSLVWGSGASDRHTVTIAKLTSDFQKYPLRFRSGDSTDNGRLEIVAYGGGAFSIGTASLMPADNILGWRADTVALVKELDSPVYRWPGGNFVSGYDWKDGIGDPDKRPPRKNPAWKGIESNDVGIHEYMALCREIDTEPFIAVNTGLGDAQSAAEEVQYLNGSVDTPMGQLRAQNGHPEPFGVKWFAVGNEMFGDWQLGHMPLAEYVKKHNDVVDKMKAMDATLKPIGVGFIGDWSRQMLTTCSDHMDLISEHIYWQDKDTVVEHVSQISEGIKRIADAHRSYRKEIPNLEGKDIRIALDEWNYWYGPNEFGELGVRYFLRDALGIAAGLHEMFRNSDLFYMANYAQTVNVIGAIKTTKTEAEIEPTGLVLKLYRQYYGEIPLEVSGNLGPVDVAAAWTKDRTAITIGIVNPTTESRTIDIDMQGAQFNGDGRRWVITGDGPLAGNRPGKQRGVDVHHESLQGIGSTLEAPPLSVTLYSLSVH